MTFEDLDNSICVDWDQLCEAVPETKTLEHTAISTESNIKLFGFMKEYCRVKNVSFVTMFTGHPLLFLVKPN